MSRCASIATMTGIGLLCKSIFKTGLCSLSVKGLPTLLTALKSAKRDDGIGVVTGASIRYPLTAHCSDMQEQFQTIFPRRPIYFPEDIRLTISTD